MSKNIQKSVSLKVNSTSETADAQYDLEKLRWTKKRQMKSHQYSNYTKTFYGTPTEKEDMKRCHREALLRQCKEKEETSRHAFFSKVKESQEAVKTDRNYIDTDKKEKGSRAEYLRQFRDQNKVLMEKRAESLKFQKHTENQRERELLKHDPINWSKTLV